MQTKYLVTLALVGCGGSSGTTVDATIGNPDAPADGSTVPCSAPGVRLCLDFEDLTAASTTTRDHGPSGNAAQITNVAPVRRNAQSLGAQIGNTSTIELDDLTSYDLVNDATMSAWILPNAAVPTRNAWLLIDQQQYGIEITPSRQVFCVFVLPGDDGIHVQSTAALTGAGSVWHHIACTRAFDTVTLYIDGVVVATTKGGTGDLYTGSTDPLEIGEDRTPTSPSDAPFLGAIDDLQLFDRAQSAAEIASYYASNR